MVLFNRLNSGSESGTGKRWCCKAMVNECRFVVGGCVRRVEVEMPQR